MKRQAFVEYHKATVQIAIDNHNRLIERTDSVFCRIDEQIIKEGKNKTKGMLWWKKPMSEKDIREDFRDKKSTYEYCVYVRTLNEGLPFEIEECFKVYKSSYCLESGFYGTVTPLNHLFLKWEKEIEELEFLISSDSSDMIICDSHYVNFIQEFLSEE